MNMTNKIKKVIAYTKSHDVNKLGSSYNLFSIDAKRIAEKIIHNHNYDKFMSVKTDKDHLIEVKFDNRKFNSKLTDNVGYSVKYSDVKDIVDKIDKIFDIFEADMKTAGYDGSHDGDWDSYYYYMVDLVSDEKYKKMVGMNENHVGKQINYYKLLSETSIPIDYPAFTVMSEAVKVKVTDATLTNMLKFITDKYNALDFSEIEKSAGDISRFKYTDMIQENTRTLNEIYQNAISDGSDNGARKYMDVITAINMCIDHLRNHTKEYSTLYKAGNGLVQLMYTSIVAGCLYATGTLVSNTIRFVTVEQDTDCQVMYDEIPGAIKHVHLKNILDVNNNLDDFSKLVDELYAKSAKKSIGDLKTNKTLIAESVTAVSVLAGIGIAAFVIYMIPKVIMLVREIIYSIYYNRVKVSDMLQLQIDLLKTNIESLEAGRGKKKIIARQKSIVTKLEKWKNKISVKMDTTNALVNAEIKKEDNSLKITKDSQYDFSDVSNTDLMI